PVTHERKLAEIVAGMKPADRLLLAVDTVQDLDFPARDDVEASAQLALAHDALAGAESHWHYCVAPANWQRREVVGEHGGSHPVQHQGEPAPPGGHEREEKGAGGERRRPAMQGDATNLGYAVATAEQRDLAEPRRMARLGRLSSDVGEDVAPGLL